MGDRHCTPYTPKLKLANPYRSSLCAMGGVGYSNSNVYYIYIYKDKGP